MKRAFLILLTLSVYHSVCAQPAQPRTQLRVLERGAHHRTVETTTEILKADGSASVSTNRYIEVATGLCYKDPGKPGAWLDTRQAFRSVPEGAVADEGPHRVHLSGNIAGANSVKLVAADGKHFVSRPWGLAFRDLATGQQTLIAQVKDSQGVLLEPNVVVYLDAFEGCHAALKYTYTRAGFEQDVLLLDEGFGRPEDYGMNGATTVIEMWTEFTTAPRPQKRARVVDGLTDETLDFGEAVIQEGRAFTVGEASESIPVSKNWVQADNRTFLVEAIPYARLRPLLDALQAQDAANQRAAKNFARLVNDRDAFAAQFQIKNQAPGRAAMPIRQANKEYAQLKSSAVVIDYFTVNGTLTGVTFSNQTYYVSGATYLSSQVTFEAGSVFKFAAGQFLQVDSGTTVNFQGSPYWPVTFTAKDDNSVGQTISGSTGTPSGYYANPALRFAGNSTMSHTLQNLRVCYASTALVWWFDGSAGSLVRHAQFVNCQNGIESDYSSGTLKLQNILFHQVQNALNSMYYCNVAGQHWTVNTATWLSASPHMSSVTLQNSLLASVSNLGSYTGSGNAVDNTGSAFQSAGEGAHYLANSSSHRDQGTGAVDANLAADLVKMTTYPPTTLASPVSTATTLVPNTPRDTGTYDRGYHYWPLDYLIGNVIVSAPLTFSNGVCIGIRGTHAMDVRSTITAAGGPLAINRIASCQNVQEQPGHTGGQTFMEITSSTPYPNMRFRFTEFTVRQGYYGALLYSYTYRFNNLVFQDCRVRGGSLSVYPDSIYSANVAFTNNIFERCAFTFYHYYYSQNTPISVYLYNNLFRLGFVAFYYDYGSSVPNWYVYDNLFDVTPQTISGNATSAILRGYNGYTAGTVNSLGGANNKTGLNPDYQTGTYGSFYYPASGGHLSQLIDAGSRTAAAAGLYHYTTRNDNSKELNTQVDIGYHYVAANVSGQPIDTDSEGLPDYIEDVDGDGFKDAAESSITLADTDSDALSDAEESSLGSNPNSANTLSFQMTDENDTVLSSPVTTEQVAVRADLRVHARLDGAPANIPGLVYQWTVGGSRIKTYEHDIDEVTPYSPPVGGSSDPARHRHLAIALSASDLTAADVNFFWKNTGNPHPVTVLVTKGFFTRQMTRNFTVNLASDPSKFIYCYDEPNGGSPSLQKTPDGLALMYDAITSHENWHGGSLMADAERPTPIGASGDIIGGETYWGDAGWGGTTYNGSAFSMWHEDYIDAHIAWRNEFGVPAIQVGVFPTISEPWRLELPEYLKFNPSPNPPNPNSGITSGTYGYRRLGEFQSRDQLGRGYFTWHNNGHVYLSEVDDVMGLLSSPATMDDIFWKWHSRVHQVDPIWTTDQAVVISTTPPQSATVSGSLTQIIIAFDRKVSFNASTANTIQLKANALTVNGVAATGLADYGGSFSQAMVFQFTIANPATGPVSCVLTGTASYQGASWSFTKNP